MPAIFNPTVSNWISAAPGPGSANSSSRPFTNPTATTLHYNGISGEVQTGNPIFEAPFDTDPKLYLYRLSYSVKASGFQSLARDAAGPYGGYHVGESNFGSSPGGILSFVREFARVPDTRTEFESYVYRIQFLTWTSIVGTTGTGDSQIIEVAGPTLEETPITVPSRVQFDYFLTDNPSTIHLGKAPRAFIFGGFGYMIHGWGLLKAGQQVLAEDALLRPWKGKIYERHQRFVEFRKPSEEI